MNLTDLERELDAACGGKSLDEMKGRGMKLDIEAELKHCCPHANSPRIKAVAFEALSRLKKIGELASLFPEPMCNPDACETIKEILRLCGVNHE